MVLPAPTPEFLTQYSNAKTLVQTALLENRNIVLLGNKGANGKTFLQNEMKNDSKFANYDIFYDRIVKADDNFLRPRWQVLAKIIHGSS